MTLNKNKPWNDLSRKQKRGIVLVGLRLFLSVFCWLYFPAIVIASFIQWDIVFLFESIWGRVAILVIVLIAIGITFGVITEHLANREKTIREQVDA